MRKTKQLVILGLIGILSMTGGCKKELTQEEVEQTEYYQNLLSQYHKLEKKNNKLSKELEEATAEDPKDKEVGEFLDKIRRDSLIKIEIAYGDTEEESVFLENKGLLSLANQLADKADVVELYTVDNLRLEQEHLYTYTLYDEDNSVFELEVYEGNYVIFKDLPERVFYVYEADQFGEAFLKKRTYYPTVSLQTKMAESPLVLQGNKVYSNEVAYKVVCHMNEIQKKEIKKKAVKEKLTKQYQFHYRGEVITVSVGKTVIKMDDSHKVKYYQISLEEMKALKEIFLKKK